MLTKQQSGRHHFTHVCGTNRTILPVIPPYTCTFPPHPSEHSDCPDDTRELDTSYSYSWQTKGGQWIVYTCLVLPSYLSFPPPPPVLPYHPLPNHSSPSSIILFSSPLLPSLSSAPFLSLHPSPPPSPGQYIGLSPPPPSL